MISSSRLTPNDVGLFIDFENVAITAEASYGHLDLAPILRVIAQYGRCVIGRAYGDWSRFGRYKQELLDHNLEAVQLFRYTSLGGKNAADLEIALDVAEIALRQPNVHVFVLITGDSDFTPVVRRLRSYGKYVVVMGFRETTSEFLARASDEFLYLDEILTANADNPSYSLEHSRQLLVSAMHRLAPRFIGGLVPASSLKLEMLKLDPQFDESKLGYEQFAHFLEFQSDLVEIHQNEDGYLVSLRSQSRTPIEIDDSLQYRMALTSAGFKIPSAEVRRSILADLFQILHEEPAQWRLDELISQLQKRFEADRTAYSADDFREVTRLLKLARVFHPQPQSWELDLLSLAPHLNQAEFILHCESVYVGILLQHHLPIREEAISELLYGDKESIAVVRRLVALAQETRSESGDEKALVDGYEWPRRLVEGPEFRIVLRDLASAPLNQEPSLEEAVRLNAEGLRIRASDFERAQLYFLRAARMMYELLRRKEPGASLMELEWYLASYTAAAAGAAFTRRNYSVALAYYHAFFALVKETEPVWDRVRKVVPPMLAFYFTLAANEYNETLPVSPGRTHPARLAVFLHGHSNPKVRIRWLELAQALRTINPPLLRSIIQRLAFLEKEGLAGAKETRETLTRLVNDEPLPADPLEMYTSQSSKDAEASIEHRYRLENSEENSSQAM